MIYELSFNTLAYIHLNTHAIRITMIGLVMTQIYHKYHKHVLFIPIKTY